MAEALVLGAVTGYILAAVCLVGLRIGHARIRARAPSRPAVGADDLSAYELAVLAAGTGRLGEVALADLYLAGRITAHGCGAVARSAGARTAELPGDAFPRLLDAGLPAEAAAPAGRLVAAVARTDAATAPLWRLRRLGLLLRPPATRTFGRVRGAARLLHLLAGGIAAAGAGWSLRGDPASSNPLDERVLAVGAAVLCCGAALLPVRRWIGGAVAAASAALAVPAAGAFALGPRPGVLVGALLLAAWAAAQVALATTGRTATRTPAGDLLLAESAASAARPPGTPRDAALRTVALRGLAALRRDAGRRRAAHPVSRELAAVRGFALACGRRVGARGRPGGRDRSPGARERGSAPGRPAGDVRRDPDDGTTER
ncbi:TIGR04222 domain-containing membrane protein [Marinitenerispora sediminis]|uniref:TIGR04222 domain-containing membrane protein n=1 Tax=Marinitenerispora sediminis TaxID=1931232 RepID=A0A368T3H9_9ACTN|nr:TIGR04222 domain-containing membrane protein [Marinitenerispora sediminis]RCV49522.1 TIGR04222 domain-containing membrane protein [Marinitenerispora sediminis]RCV55828.1 TIGR04222 domain-containing membrane protein [Marinitenerispora sediminis]RCV56902.1 TIGR04222 domain-containing membrane protein [Marinitenerispora sediminis]